MNLFDVIPANFFSVLSSKNKGIYADALMLLHSMFRYDLNIRVDDFLSSLISQMEDKEFMPEEDDEETGGILTPNIKARLVLNRLVKTGWVDKEFMDGSFVEIITPRDYAIRTMKLLEELCDHTLREYNSLVFATYSGLKQAKTENPDQMYEAVLSAKANTEKLTYELRSLYHSIRNYLRQIQEHSDVNQLLKNHFEEYKRMADRIYHPIKTLDSVHRYMAPIQDILSDVFADESLLALMRSRAMAFRKYQQEDEASADIIASIDMVLSTYGSIGNIINEIDRKHSAYTKNSIDKIQYLITADQSIKGKLVELFKAYTSSFDAKKEKIGALLERNIRVNRQGFIDGRSLYHKNIRSRQIQLESLAVNQEDGFSSAAMADMLALIKDSFPAARIRAYVESLFAEGQSTISSENIPLENDTSFILLMLSILRANEQSMEHRVKIGTGWVMRNGYRIPNLTIMRKQGK